MRHRLTIATLFVAAAPALMAQAAPAKPAAPAAKPAAQAAQAATPAKTATAKTTTVKTSAAGKLAWGPAPAVFPKGATMAVVSGDPGKAAMFSIELSMPDGYKILPHFHPTDETIEVKKGTFVYGMGDTFDVSKASTMKVGDKGSIKAQMHHFATAKGATIIQVTAMGPFVLTYVNPADDPSAKK
jgi:glucose/arabinose dehydrogenase